MCQEEADAVAGMQRMFEHEKQLVNVFDSSEEAKRLQADLDDDYERYGLGAPAEGKLTMDELEGGGMDAGFDEYGTDTRLPPFVLQQLEKIRAAKTIAGDLSPFSCY